MAAILKYNKNTQKVTIEDECCDYVICAITENDDEVVIRFEHDIKPELLPEPFFDQTEPIE